VLNQTKKTETNCHTVLTEEKRKKPQTGKMPQLPANPYINPGRTTVQPPAMKHTQTRALQHAQTHMTKEKSR